MSFALPQNTDKRPFAILGAGTLGRRIALMLRSSCWGNSPQARAAIRAVIRLAQQDGR